LNVGLVQVTLMASWTCTCRRRLGKDRAARPRPRPRLPGRDGLDRSRHQERGLKHRASETRTIAIPPDSWSCCALTSRGTARPRTGRSSRPPGEASRTWPTAPCGPGPV